MARMMPNERTLGFESGSRNRYLQVLEIAHGKKAQTKPLQRPSLAEQFFRENPMPWLLDADPIDEPESRKANREDIPA